METIGKTMTNSKGNIFPDVIHENKFTRIIIKLLAHIFSEFRYTLCFLPCGNSKAIEGQTTRPNLLTFFEGTHSIGYPGGNIG